MESNNTANTSDLLIKLTRLEDQVTALSSQLDLDKITISQLKLSLTDRDSQIIALEAKLNIAGNSLRDTTSIKLHQTRDQLIKGLDIKLVSVVLGHIQQYIDLVQSFVDDVQQFIQQKYAEIHDHYKIALNLLQQAPDQAYGYYQKRLVEPADAFIKKTLHSAHSHYKTGRLWLELELIDPGLALLDRIVFLARELPLEARRILQTRVIEPALNYMDQLPTIINGIRVDISAWIMALLKQLGRLVQQFLAFIEDQITKSSFWDGKNRMQQTPA